MATHMLSCHTHSHSLGFCLCGCHGNQVICHQLVVACSFHVSHCQCINLFCMHLLHNTPFIVCVYIPVHVYVCVCDWLWSIVTVDTCMHANYYHLPCALNATAINFGSGLVWVTSHTIFGYAVGTCTVCICVHTMYMYIHSRTCLQSPGNQSF